MAWVVGIGIAIFLLVAFPRQMGIVVLVVIGLIGAVWLYFTMQSQNAERERSLVSISIMGPGNPTCTEPAHPVWVSFSNGGPRRVSSISFEIVGKRPGYSSTVIDDYWTSDRIIDPNTRWDECYPANKYTVSTLAKRTASHGRPS